jgi:hypothetical protein
MGTSHFKILLYFPQLYLYSFACKKSFFYKYKSTSSNIKGLVIVWLPGQSIDRTFCVVFKLASSKEKLKIPRKE